MRDIRTILLVLCSSFPRHFESVPIVQHSLCELCLRKENPTCYENGLYSDLGYPKMNGSKIYVEILLSLKKTEECKVIVQGSQVNWNLDNFVFFGHITQPNRFYLRSETKPLEGSYTLLFADNKKLQFDVFYPASILKDVDYATLNASKSVIPVTKRFHKCLIRSKNKSKSLKVYCNDLECDKEDVSATIDDSLRYINLYVNTTKSFKNLTLKCLMKAGVHMKGMDFFIEMKFKYYPLDQSERLMKMSTPKHKFDVAFVVVGIFVVIFWVNAVILLIRKRRPRKISESKNVSLRTELLKNKSSEKQNKLAAKAFPEWAKDRYFTIAKIEIGKVLGKGQYGVVRRGKLSDGPYKKWDVAIKESSNDLTEDLLAEGKIMSVVGYHDHIVNLQCVSWDMKGNLFLILEYCHNGCLNDFLRSEEQSFISGISAGIEDNFWSKETLLIWAKQISSGMEFLDSKNVIHGDLAGRNILLSLEYAAKISDFGLAHNLYQDLNYKKITKRRLPVIWMGPETFGQGTITKKSDVWAFGILIWEIYSFGKQPYDGFPNEIVLDLIKQGVCTLKRPFACAESVWLLMQSCWSMYPDDRPSFKSLKLSLESLISEEGSKHKKNVENGIANMQKRFFDNPGYMTMFPS